MDTLARKLENESYTRPRRLRAYIEVTGAELAVYPIADCDTEEREILDTLRVFLGER